MVEDMFYEGTECNTRLAYPREPFCNFLSRANEYALFVIVVLAGRSEEIYSIQKNHIVPVCSAQCICAGYCVLIVVRSCSNIIVEFHFKRVCERVV